MLSLKRLDLFELLEDRLGVVLMRTELRDRPRRPEAHGRRVTLGARRQSTSVFDRKPRVTYTFYVRNASHSHAMAGNESELLDGMSAVSGWFPFFSLSSSGSASFFVRGALVSFPAPYGLREEKIDWDPVWYADAELVILQTTDAGAVLRILDIPRASLVSKR